MSKSILRPAALALRTLRPSATTKTVTTTTATTTLLRAFTTTTPIVEPTPSASENATANATSSNPTAHVRPLAFKKSHPAPPPTPIPNSLRTLLPLLAAQPSHYITVHIHGFPYLVQEGDQIRLPFRMPGVQAGDVLRLNRASVLGSRDYTMKGAPHIEEGVFECRAVVLGTEAEPLRVKVKKKRRQRRMRQAKSKHRYTVLRISELRVMGDLDTDGNSE